MLECAVLVSARLTPALSRTMTCTEQCPTVLDMLLHAWQIYKRSGIDTFRESLRARGQDYLDAVNWMSYQLAPRAIIFRRDAAQISDLDAFKHMMRYNHYRFDEVCFSLLLCGELAAAGMHY